MRRDVSIIILYDEKGRFSVQERGDHSKFGEKYAFFGGGIEQGETPEEALHREIKEELEIDLKEHSFLGSFYNECVPNHWSKRYLYAAQYKEFKHKMHIHEGKGLRMVTLEEFMKLDLFPKDKEAEPLIKKFLEKNLLN